MSLHTLLATLLLTLLSCSLGAQPPQLKRGVNLSSSYANVPILPYLYRWPTTTDPTDDRDFQNIASAGFDHVRLPVHFFIQTPGFGVSLDKLPVDYAAAKTFLDALTVENSDAGRRWRVFDMVMQAPAKRGLTLVIDMHYDRATEEAIEASPLYLQKLVTLWTWVADRYVNKYKLQPHQLVFELLNEPRFDAATARSVYTPFLQQAIRAIRGKVGSDYVILIQPPMFGLGTLTEPSIDPRVIAPNDPLVWYAAHFYDPFVITHQGYQYLYWNRAQRLTSRVMNLPYPAALAKGRPVCMGLPATSYPKGVPLDNCIYILPGQITADEARAQLQAYIDQDWGPARIRESLRFYREWADTFGVKLIVNEFGAVDATTINADMETGLPRRYGPEPQYKMNWLKDVREALEYHGLGWTVWDYAGGFQITYKVGATWNDNGFRRWDWSVPASTTNPRAQNPRFEMFWALGMKLPTAPSH
ncbi:glycoside hydrolase family 5 protein [Zoogloea sp.]|uniref:glycoside hydrolase family 5 protein n=1 Tax=Zoogloea sp. TaxID=49181 RepID=UPI0035B22BC8|nr:glycoside hydrolase family 5 protein [Rhodocyclales bacterium]